MSKRNEKFGILVVIIVIIFFCLWVSFEDIEEDDDYDQDRYYSDDDYADGVDDAMDELDW